MVTQAIAAQLTSQSGISSDRVGHWTATSHQHSSRCSLHPTLLVCLQWGTYHYGAGPAVPENPQPCNHGDRCVRLEIFDWSLSCCQVRHHPRPPHYLHICPCHQHPHQDAHWQVPRVYQPLAHPLWCEPLRQVSSLLHGQQSWGVG